MFSRRWLSWVYSKERLPKSLSTIKVLFLFTVFSSRFYAQKYSIYSTVDILTSLLFALFNRLYIVSQKDVCPSPDGVLCLQMLIHIPTFWFIVVQVSLQRLGIAGEGVLFSPENIKHYRKEGKKSSFSESCRRRQISAINTLSTCV